MGKRETGRHPFNESVPAFFSELRDLLPFYAEEQSEGLSISLDSLRELLRTKLPGLTIEGVECLLEASLCLFNTLGVLDARSLENGDLRFVSHPARVFSFAAIDALAYGASLLGIGFWSGGTITQAEERHRVVRWLEEKRVAVNPNAPITRYSHVSWGLVKLGDLFLCVPREGCEKGECEVRHGRMVLPGGRIRRDDLPSNRGSATPERQLQSAGFGERSDEIYLHGLEREIKEEIGLEGNDYNAEFIRDLDPYVGVFGSSDACSYTETRIRLYSINLNSSGAIKLAPFLEGSNRTHWFTARELLDGNNTAGHTVFFDAGKKSMTLGELDAVRDSFSVLCHSDEREYIILTKDEDHLFVGDAKAAPNAKPKKSRIEKGEDEILLLLGLAKRSFRFPEEGGKSVYDDFALEIEGIKHVLWGICVEDSTLWRRFSQLAQHFPGLILADRDYFQLRCAVNFSPAFFTWKLSGDSLVLYREELHIASLGLTCPERDMEIELTPAVSRGLSKNRIDSDNWRKSGIREEMLIMGLRDFVKRRKGEYTYEVVCQRRLS